MEDGRKKIIFIDDEPAVLDGLRDSLRKFRNKWEMFFEQDPEKALSFIAETPIDVVVSDMRMPQIDGATLLQQVKKEHPSAVRIVLSGFTEIEVAIRAISVAHQFMTKPCDAEELERVVERACRVQDMLRAEDLRSVVGKLDRLPTTPKIFAEVTEAMTSPHATAPGIAKIIEQDPAMCAKLLQMSNSGFFRLARPISRVEDAIVYLGYNMIKNLVLSTEVFTKTLSGKKQRAQKELQAHSHLTALLSLRIAKDKRIREDAFLAAILHDVGKLILASENKSYPDDVVALMGQDQCTFTEAERRLYQVSHSKVGAYLLGLWGVPFNVVEAVAYHHRPELIAKTSADEPLDAVSTVALANALAQHALPSKIFPEDDGEELSKLAELLGRQDELPSLQAEAVQCARVARSI